MEIYTSDEKGVHETGKQIQIPQVQTSGDVGTAHTPRSARLSLHSLGGLHILGSPE